MIIRFMVVSVSGGGKSVPPTPPASSKGGVKLTEKQLLESNPDRILAFFAKTGNNQWAIDIAVGSLLFLTAKE